ncbi:MAG: hypothetical protein ABW128_14285 [Rhizorhabdus sp.]
MTIDIDTDRNIVLVRQRWMYQWTKAADVDDWTLAEKRAYHRRFEAAILRGWNNRATLRVTGASPFARSMARATLSLRIDVLWALQQPHWTVTVKKMSPGKFEVSKVNWSLRQIWLDTNDTTIRTFLKDKTPTTQVPVAHEYGHAFGNVPQAGHGDEYKDDSIYRKDVASMINVGDQLRVRHFDHLLAEMSQMAPDTHFVVGALK